MTARVSINDLTSDQLDELYDRLERAEAVMHAAAKLAGRWQLTPDRKRAAAELQDEITRALPEPAHGRLCGLPHYRYPESTCTEPAGHDTAPRPGPHAAPLIIDGRNCGAVAWGPDTDTREENA